MIFLFLGLGFSIDPPWKFFANALVYIFYLSRYVVYNFIYFHFPFPSFISTLQFGFIIFTEIFIQNYHKLYLIVFIRI